MAKDFDLKELEGGLADWSGSRAIFFVLRLIIDELGLN